MKIGVIGKIHEDAHALLETIGDATIVCVPDGDAAAIQPAIDDADGLLIRTSKVSQEALDRAPGLKVVSRHGVGYDNLPLAELNRRKIALAVSATANMVSVAEHAISLMLAISKNVIAADYAVRHAGWAARNAMQLGELAGKTLLIVGFGRIGREVAKRALAFEMRVFVFDPYVGDDAIEDAGCARMAVIEEEIGCADFVSLHQPSNAQSAGLFDAVMLARMKKGAILINTARGGIVDEEALADCLRSGHLRGAGLDVLAEEPPAKGHPLFACDNLVLSPHMAGVTSESLRRMGMEAATNLIDVLQGRMNPAVIVNFNEVTSTND